MTPKGRVLTDAANESYATGLARLKTACEAMKRTPKGDVRPSIKCSAGIPFL